MSLLSYGLIALLILGAGLVLWLALREQRSKLLVTSWGDLQENHVLLSLIDDFRKANPRCEVQVERLPFPEYVPTLTKDIAAGAGPDVIFVEANNFMDFYARKSLAPLNDFIHGDHLDLNSFYPQIVNRFSVKNQVYALPRDTAPICLVYYNKMAFEEAGLPFPTGQWEWKAFAETAQ